MRGAVLPHTIVFVVPSLSIGGAESVCVILANYFASKGYDSRIWVLNLKKPQLLERVDPRVTVCDLKTPRLRGAPLALCRMLLGSRAATYLIFNQNMALSMLVARFILGRKDRIVTRLISHLTSKKKMETKMNRWISDPLAKIILPQSDLIIAQSESMRADLVDGSDRLSTKVVTIHNPVLEQNEPHRLFKRPLQILFVGRLSPEKNVDVILRAFCLVLQNYPQCKLVIVGEGPEELKLKALAQKLMIESLVVFAGYQADVAPWFRNSRLTVLTSTYEGFPNALVESISFGTPVVSYDCESGPAEIIENGLNGFLVANQNFEELVKKIEAALIPDAFDAELVKKSSARFGIEKIGRMYEAALLGDKTCAE